MNHFVARYEENGIKKSFWFDKTKFDVNSATEFLKNNNVKNFFFFFEPVAPVKIDDSTMMFSGEVGFDITTDLLLPHIKENKNLYFDSFGGDLWDALKTYDLMKTLNYSGKVGIMGSCMSAATLYPLAVPIENRIMSENSRFLIHHPWSHMVGNYEEMQREADDLKIESLNIANIYAANSNMSVEEIMAFMNLEKIIRKDEMIQMGMILNSENSIIPKININENQIEMTQDDKNWLESAFDKLTKAFSKVKNLLIQDANGMNLDFGDQIETEDQIAVGMTAKYEDGTIPTGEVLLPSGKTLVFDNGTITEIKEAAPSPDQTEEMEALKTENEQLKQQLADLQAKSSDAEIQNKINAGIQAKLSEIKSEMTTLIEERTEKTPDNRIVGLKDKFKN